MSNSLKMRQILTSAIVLLIPTVYIQTSQAALADTWDYCNCRWNPWQAWEACSSNCFGIRWRSREVTLTQYPGCDEFNDCATNDEGWDSSTCNANCQNGGTPISPLSRCNCVTGYTGQCCAEGINCGIPTSINNGGVAYSLTFYGYTATYYCNQHYNLTGGSEVRTCQLNYIWSGLLPYCAYVNHCGSDPCENNATCTDLLDDYSCTCYEGWSGKNCDTDVQPPVIANCPSDIQVNATDSTKYIQWTEPSFTDPLGNQIDITKNYQSPNYDFPWGDFMVQYAATKVNNGLRSECNFTVSVRPTPCEELNIPANGSRICNGWKTDYGRFCQVACNYGYMIDPAHDLDTLYVCGASGTWSVGPSLPNCSISVSTVDDAFYYHAKYSDYTYNSTCSNRGTDLSLQDVYIERLTGAEWEFGNFCETFSADCVPENVEIVCG